MDFGWEKELWAQPVVGLAWQRVAGLFFSSCSRGDETVRQKPAILPKLCSFCILCCFEFVN